MICGDGCAIGCLGTFGIQQSIGAVVPIEFLSPGGEGEFAGFLVNFGIGGEVGAIVGIWVDCSSIGRMLGGIAGLLLLCSRASINGEMGGLIVGNTLGCRWVSLTNVRSIRLVVTGGIVRSLVWDSVDVCLIGESGTLGSCVLSLI